jgi:hypothetical protein
LSRRSLALNLRIKLSFMVVSPSGFEPETY